MMNQIRHLLSRWFRASSARGPDEREKREDSETEALQTALRESAVRRFPDGFSDRVMAAISGRSFEESFEESWLFCW